jgi:hypothetical protein
MRRYLAIWLCCSLALLGGTALLNLLVDPFWVFGTAKYTGLTRPRSQAIQQPTLAKAYLLARYNPTTLLIGSSRTEIGLDPRSPKWPLKDRPVFNMGLAGSDLKVRYEYLKYALGVAKPKLVVIELTFEDSFGRGIEEGAADSQAEAPSQPGGAPPITWRQRLYDMVFALWSLNALEGSLQTLSGDNGPHRSSMTEAGFNSGGDLRAAAENDGYGYVVAIKDRSLMRTLINWSTTRSMESAAVGRMIDLATSKGAAVIVAILPGYVDELESYRQVRAWDDYSNWKERLTAITEAFRAKGRDVSLWNFSTYSPYTTQDLPAPGDKQHHLEWFWETNHFKSALGDHIIQRMTKGAPDDFGEQLTVKDLRDQIAADALRQQNYASAQPKGVDRVREIYSEQLRRFCSENMEFCKNGSP